MTDLIKLYSDGGSRGNRIGRGRCAIGVVLCDVKDNVLLELGEYLGLGTNNWAEYKALIKGLTLAREYSSNRVECYSDSQLIVNQLNGLYKVKDVKLKNLYLQVKELEKCFRSVCYNYVSREHPMIARADMLLNRELEMVNNRI
ncbi:MAG: ribonuclease HI family protein [Candidatus Odinarchaeum yellowstonii]|uniref:Ribonuclease HI family protein n=1 Tax=Odinarchaeota yellowstonii (strain LCB_4) TaxID=1841599 RepID=A0AAF0D225_ODILC|nr:MAG: ribonuclease HI family protein [Candidatus Odinarchaeum yellowstonii]